MGKRARRRGDVSASGNGDAAAERPAPQDTASSNRRPGSDGRLTEVSYLIAEADLLLHLYRWIVLCGDLPKAQDWLADERWPHPDAAVETFGSWEGFLKEAAVADSPLIQRARRHEEEARRMAARERELERDEGRAADLRRREELAGRRREEAEAARDEHDRRATRLEARAAAAEQRADHAEIALADQRRAAERTAQATRGTGADGEPSEEWLTAHEGALAELESVRAHREELLAEIEGLREATEHDRRAIARLSALVGEEGAAAREDGAVTAPAGADEPATPLEAVRRARAGARYLVFTDAAEESASDSPFRRPADLLEALLRLDRLAELHAPEEGFGASLGQAARDLGLNWKQGVSDTARSRKPHAYAVTHEGQRLDLGPHIAVGSGSGAGYIARIYLAVEDGAGELPRGLYVGHVGRHLPDTTT
ncbi:MAG: hypothetical protein MSC31_18995 [Solirubrobacteraceae bacterium MAG38_C4-C5]|nr:hypothetical protein [Candidatus Siliceabacter maunaloa]